MTKPISMSNGGSNGANGNHISPFELESLANGDFENKNAGLDRLAASSLPENPIAQLKLMAKLYFELYPRVTVGVTTFCVCMLLWLWAPWSYFTSHRGMHRNYMTHDYTALQDNFNFQTAQIDHWCLFGGDDRCYCEDPTEPQPREEAKGWVTAHNRNKKLADLAIKRGGVDVVFLGDQNIQSWDGRWMDKPAPDGFKISAYWNQTFNNPPESSFRGVALGIYGDRINNILWRIQHGEVPPALEPKVFWLIMGTNDLALGLCSEEVVTLGIMRVAEELHHCYPDSVIVIQGILPRSNHKDGSLEGKSSSRQDAIRMKYIKKAHLKEEMEKDGGNTKADYMPMITGMGNPRRHRKLQLSDDEIYHYNNNPMDKLLEAYLDNYEDTNLTDDLFNNYWDAIMTSDDTPSMEQRKLQSPTIGQAETAAETPPAAETTATTTTTTSSSATMGGIGGAPSRPKATIARTPSGLQWDRLGNTISKERLPQAPLPHYDFYLWPSIKAINKELEGFCSKHEHFVYFDADDLVLGSLGNDHYKAAHKTIIHDLMPNYVHLSYLGHQVVIDVLNDELKRIIYDDNEENDIETRSSKGSSGRGGGRQ